MKVVVAPDKFKGSLTAVQVAAAIEAGLRSAAPATVVVSLPVADGGDGTVDAAVAAGFTRVPVRAPGPTGEPVATSYARSGNRAVVELADVVGPARLPAGAPDPMGASTYGLGVVVAHAIDHGATRVAIGVGGSASTDGGAGLVQALGARIIDQAGVDVPPGASGLQRAARLDLEALHARIAGVGFVVAVDVDNPLVGPRGAAAVFGPQKGASPVQVEALDGVLRHWSRLVLAATGADLADAAGAGAAGGTGYAALSLLGAESVRGIDLVLDLVGFREALDGADLVITGEGSLDEQSLGGKAPIGVAREAATVGVPVVAAVGRCLLPSHSLADAGIRAVYALTDLEPDDRRSVTRAAALLEHVGRSIAADWLR